MPNIPELKVGSTIYDLHDKRVDALQNALGTVPSGQTVQGQITDLKNALGTVPSGKTAQGQITNNASDIVDLKSALGTVPSGQTAQGQITDLKSAFNDAESVQNDMLRNMIDETDHTGDYIVSKFNVRYDPGTGVVSVAYWTLYKYAVNGGDIIHVKSKNYNDEATGMLIILGANDTILEYYAEADDRIIILPKNATAILLNTNRHYDNFYFGTCIVSTVPYKRVEDHSPHILNTSLTGFGNGTVSNNIITVSGQNSGARTNQFKAASNVVAIDVDIDLNFANTSIIAIQLAVINTSGSTAYTVLKGINTGSASSFSGRLTFDASSLIVYENASEFFIVINSVNTANSGTVTVNKLKIYETTTFAQNDLYDSNLEKMAENVFSKITQIDSEIESLDAPTLPVLCDANGNKYSLNISTSGIISSIPHIPNDVLFIGNSLLLGMDTNGDHGGAFGMAATDYTKDFCYLVEQEILEKNTSCSFDKIHCAAFEQGYYQNYMNAYSDRWTGKDLIICQIGDNVNTAERQTIFTAQFPNLVKSFKTLSPNARIVLVGVWFGVQSAHNALVSAAERYGCVYVDISDLCVSENFATVGETITYKDGTTGTMESGWVSHPGNNGMKKIAERIIDVLDM